MYLDLICYSYELLATNMNFILEYYSGPKPFGITRFIDYYNVCDIQVHLNKLECRGKVHLFQ